MIKRKNKSEITNTNQVCSVCTETQKMRVMAFK